MHIVLTILAEKQWTVDCDRLCRAVRPDVRNITRPFRKDMSSPKSQEDRQEWYRRNYEALRARCAPGQDLVKRRCMGIGVSTHIREGKWFLPGDSESFWQCVCAGHSLNDRRVPVFKKGGVTVGDGGVYAWLPLARRVCLDRVYNTLLLRKDFFQEIRASDVGHTAASSI